MAIFSRRTLDCLICENARFLTRKQVRKQIDDLNRAGDSAIASEWEIVLLNALSKVGSVEHERNFGGTTNPDVHFTSNENSDFEFVADITSASDKGIDQQYSMWPLLRAIQKTFEDSGLNRNHVYLEGGGNAEQVFRREDRAKLPWMPGEPRFEQVIFKNVGFTRFLAEIKRRPDKWRQYRFDMPINLTITYDPRQTSAGMRHFNYKQANLLEWNPVYTALRTKYEQLKESNYSGLRGIILCDGGSDLFHHFEGDFGTTYGVDQIVRHFLKAEKIKEVIGFVITITAESRQSTRYSLPHIIDPIPAYAVEIKLHVSQTADAARRDLDSLVEKLRGKFPLAVTHAANAMDWNNCELRHEGVSFEGGLSVSDDEVQLSARSLLKLLAGKISLTEFQETHGFSASAISSSSTSNPFEEMLNEGRLIRNVTVQKFEDEDDDYITFVFGEPDPAVSKFKNSASK